MQQHGAPSRLRLLASLLLVFTAAAVKPGSVPRNSKRPSVRGASAKLPAAGLAKDLADTKGSAVNASAVHLALRRAAGAAGALAKGRGGRSRRELEEGCGGAPTYENSRPKDFADARKTKYDEKEGKTVPVTFQSGDTIVFECLPGFSIDGSKDGEKEYDVECSEHGYYKPQGVCLKASKCGPVPEISKAMPTGKFKNNRAEFACQQGYSTDGKKVVGAFGANRFFELECIEFSGKYEEFTGECKPYAFVPASETIRLYNKVSEALFTVSCIGTLKVAFGKGEAPKGLGDVCGVFAEPDPSCAGLVTTITGAFEKQTAAREEYDSKTELEWYEEKTDRPGITDDAKTFCTELWKLLELPG
jgi:hypothetical protein